MLYVIHSQSNSEEKKIYLLNRLGVLRSQVKEEEFSLLAKDRDKI